MATISLAGNTVQSNVLSSVLGGANNMRTFVSMVTSTLDSLCPPAATESAPARAVTPTTPGASRFADDKDGTPLSAKDKALEKTAAFAEREDARFHREMNFMVNAISKGLVPHAESQEAYDQKVKLAIAAEALNASRTLEAIKDHAFKVKAKSAYSPVIAIGAVILKEDDTVDSVVVSHNGVHVISLDMLT